LTCGYNKGRGAVDTCIQPGLGNCGAVNELTEESPMKINLVFALSAVAALASVPALAQQANAPKASKADVEKVISSIKGDKAKLANYCTFVKLEDEADALAAKNQKDPKLQSLGQQIGDSIKKVGPDFEKIMNSELDDASGALFEDLAKSCK
jgi:hypothetical protein